MHPCRSMAISQGTQTQGTYAQNTGHPDHGPKRSPHRSRYATPIRPLASCWAAMLARSRSAVTGNSDTAPHT